MQRLTEYYDGEARAIRIDHKKAFAKLAAYEDTELTPGEVAELKQELIATRSRLVDLEKALELACIWIDNVSSLCANPGQKIKINCKENDCVKCYKEYLLKGARGEHD